MDDATNDRSHHPPSVADERGNPFVTFSRLVDRQISSFFKSFEALPSSLFHSRSSQLDDWEQEWRRRKEAIAEAEEFDKTINELFATHRKDQNEQSERPCDDRSISQSKNRNSASSQTDATTRAAPRKREDLRDPIEYKPPPWSSLSMFERTPEEEERPQTEYEEAERVMDCIRSRIRQLVPYEAQDYREPRCPYRPKDNENEERGEKLCVSSINPPLHRQIPQSASVSYFDRSPCSPANLEDQNQLRDHQAHLRNAFEDLLLVSHGRGLSENIAESGPTTKSDWIDSLATRHSTGFHPLGVGLAPAKQSNQFITRQPETDASEDAPTETDFYERRLGLRPSRAAKGIPAQIGTAAPTDPESRSLISTLTTTERQTLPDGSVYTQVVLKKRFSDGREEYTETEYTTHGQQRSESRGESAQPRKQAFLATTSSLGHDGKLKQALGQKIEEQKQHGWFWS